MDDLASVEKYARDFIQSVHKLTQIPLRKLERYGTSNNLMNVLERPLTLEPTELQLKKLEQLNAFLRAYRILKWEEENAKQVIRSPHDAGSYFNALLEGIRDRERFMVAFLDNGNHIIETRTLAVGSIDQAPIYPRFILKAALNSDCSSIILAHNHPGGSMKPSAEDLLLTKRLVDIFNPLNINILDHIIIGNKGFVSLAELGNLPRVAEGPASYEAITMNVIVHDDWQHYNASVNPWHANHGPLEDEWER
ncbi:RadC family protein [Paenibacillus terreus]|uniref:RadC family protein n=1 Tax=Paenibacillus terreus TaxID=1387834 RepID=A0ABV5BGL4_9BACL